MVEEDKGSIIEHGDLFFFYRPKVDAEEVRGLRDVQRFYMVTSPEKNGKAGPKNNIHRLFLLGQKQLPEIVQGRQTSKERNWALNVLTTSILKIYGKNFFLLNILPKQEAAKN